MTTDNVLRHRLEFLPRKTGLVLQQLYVGGLLSPETLGVILDAGDRAGDANKLLAFGIAYGDLRAAGVPVGDTLAIAKRLGVMVKLDWGAKRWKAEHDRFARAETLKLLAKENVRYDLAKFEKAIDREFPGYLIRTSRRLGMEGLRQRHCVAAYHGSVKAGYCAIASVILNRRRWTVELRLTGNQARPLAIAQIKARRNREPDEETKSAIYDCFGIKLNHGLAESEQGGDRDRAYMENIRSLAPLLRINGIARVVVTFDGGGDDGSISEIWFEGGDFDSEHAMIEIVSTERAFEEGKWVSQRVRIAKSVDDAIREVTYDYLDEANVDWYNDDGGYGELVIDIDEETVALEVNTRFTSSDTAFCEKRDIGTGDPVD